MNLLTTILAFAVCLGSLVTIHELGHYLVARWCGVKVLRFSVGMGKVVWSRRFGRDQTEWAVSALPLGGYVKMLDAREGDLSSVSKEDLAREFTRQNVWKRIAIVAAGPLANFLVAIALFAGLYLHGVAEPSSKISVRAAGQQADADRTPAALAGLRSGDHITAVNDEAVAAWSELRWNLMQAAIDKKDARLAIERPGYGYLTAVLPASVLSTLDLDGDIVGNLGIGLARPSPVVQQVLPGGAAERAGLQVGDLLKRVDGVAVQDGVAFIELIRAAPGKTLPVDVVRAGQLRTLAVTPQADVAHSEKPGQQAVTVGKIGAYVALQPDMITVPAAPLAALGKAVQRVWDTCTMTLKMIGKMVTGEASLKNVTGPITIADYAGQTARMGLASYLSFIAFISISLGVMNLLPIPVLDGGHLLYYSLEVLTGRPVSARVAEFAQRIGIGLLMTLMVLAVFNDITRLM
ncbi:RIP metalloprotease RseP [Duganella sp. Leaf126]|uniref:RIP metalloprotease RseP n=1 Tax=Duganella sp. Leaf126 TaxID=1736266 RepID=UPI0006F3EDAA|nr:RIP metalloprotease RseP [Duganella sp. Leaf126]KQQ36316.1 RIP metalloprotease RseP [Duganella sp. Leaf126]